MTDTTPAATAPDTTPAVPTNPADIAVRDQELTQLYESDPMRYQYEDGGRLAKEHLALRQAGQPKDEVVDADDAADDLADADADAIDLESDAAEVEEPAEVVETGTELAPYEPPDEQQLSAFGQAALAEVDAYAAEMELSTEVRDSLVNDLWPRVLKAQETRLVAADVEAKKASVRALGGRAAYDPLVKAGQKVFISLPKELQAALREARTKTGELVVLTPAFVQWLAGLGNRPAGQPQEGDQTAVQQELGEIGALMNSDIDAYNYKPWKTTGMTASARHLELRRALGPDAPVKPTPAEREAEEQALLALHVRDPQTFEYAPWRGTGVSGARRLYDLQMGRV